MKENDLPKNFKAETTSVVTALATFSQLSTNFAKIKNKNPLDSAKMIEGNAQI